MDLWTAFLLGLIGSLHCAGMCGPLALAIPVPRNSTVRFVFGRIVYNAGRLMTYCVLGAVLGIFGKSFALIGLQRWVSLTVGIAMLLTLLMTRRFNINARVSGLVALIKKPFTRLLSQRNSAGTFLLGTLNGLLPCGLVYAACAGAIGHNNIKTGIAYMLVFGLGTVPMMLSIGLLGQKLQFTLRFKLQNLIPATLVLMSFLLILRGLALGIPYLSPDLVHSNCCH